MPIFRLTQSIVFPPPEFADSDGLLAFGGDLSPKRLLTAYRQGIFPWYSSDTPILWWSPDPRLVLFPEELKVSKSLHRTIRKGAFRVTLDTEFAEVMSRCARVRLAQGEGTWIMPEMVEAYSRLHEMGYAHSAEAWLEGELVGGLYGVAIGRAFFGESMFTEKTDASKVAFVHVVEYLREEGFNLIDCQVTTSHLMRFGAREISRAEFLARLRQATEAELPPGRWTFGASS